MPAAFSAASLTRLARSAPENPGVLLAITAISSDCVDFIYKEDARGVLLALLEQIANARGTHADKHFDEIRSADREERNIGLARDCAREKCFSSTRGAEEQYTSRNPSAKLLELLGFL